jgi:hypothetical protein
VLHWRARGLPPPHNTPPAYLEYVLFNFFAPITDRRSRITTPEPQTAPIGWTVHMRHATRLHHISHQYVYVTNLFFFHTEPRKKRCDSTSQEPDPMSETQALLATCHVLSIKCFQKRPLPPSSNDAQALEYRGQPRFAVSRGRSSRRHSHLNISPEATRSRQSCVPFSQSGLKSHINTPCLVPNHAGGPAGIEPFSAPRHALVEYGLWAREPNLGLYTDSTVAHFVGREKNGQTGNRTRDNPKSRRAYYHCTTQPVMWRNHQLQHTSLRYTSHSCCDGRR